MLRSLIVAAAFAAAGSALADSEARKGADVVRVTLRPCENEKVQQIITAGGGDPLNFRTAHASIGGIPWNACWAPMYQKRAILVIYEDGDHGEVPFEDLKPIPEA